MAFAFISTWRIVVWVEAWYHTWIHLVLRWSDIFFIINYHYYHDIKSMSRSIWSIIQRTCVSIFRYTVHLSPPTPMYMLSTHWGSESWRWSLAPGGVCEPPGCTLAPSESARKENTSIITTQRRHGEQTTGPDRGTEMDVDEGQPRKGYLPLSKTDFLLYIAAPLRCLYSHVCDLMFYEAATDEFPGKANYKCPFQNLLVSLKTVLLSPIVMTFN